MWKQAAEGQQEIERNSPSLCISHVTEAKIRYIFFCNLPSELSSLVFVTGSDFHPPGAAGRCFNW